MKRISVLAVIIGNMLEWYDFALYIFLAPVFAQNFFPHQNKIDSLLSTLMIFAVGFFVRPMGSLFFGHLGDRIGRKATLKTSILLISLATLGLAFIPTYKQCGLYASIILVILRMLQGFCIGGEFAGSMIYLSEMAQSNRRALLSCMSNNGSNFGFLCATIIAALVSGSISQQAFYDYGWRIPFLIGGILGLCGLWLRRNLSETFVFEHLATQEKLATVPVLSVLKENKMAVLKIFILLAMSAAGSYVLMNLMSTYLHEYFHYSLSHALQVQAICNTLTFFLVTLAAIYSDRYGRRSLLIIAAIGYISLSLPCFHYLKITGQWIYLLPLVIFYCMEQATTPVTMIELFPAKTRYTGISVGYNIAMALLGGTAPLINMWLIDKLQMPEVIGIYLMLCACISLMVILKIKPQHFGQACDLTI